MFIQWSEAYALGIPSLDSDHRALISLVNHFFARAKETAPVKELESILNDVVDLAGIHFQREEALLDRQHFAGLASHIARHQRTILQLRRFIEPYRSAAPGREPTRDEAEYLTQLIVSHIVDEDLPCRPYLKKLA